MNRKDRKFSYTGVKLADVAEAMLRHYESRLAYGQDKKNKFFGRS